jgi:hypothetical protein
MLAGAGLKFWSRHYIEMEPNQCGTIDPVTGFQAQAMPG